MASANQQLVELLTAALRQAAPAAGLAAPFLGNAILPRGSRYDIPLLEPEGSPGGSLLSYSSGYMQSGAYMAMSSAQNAVRDHFYGGIARTMYRDPNDATAMAQKWASNYVVNTLYHMADPLQMQPAMATAARTVGMGMRIHSDDMMTDFAYGQRLTSMFSDTKNGLLVNAAKNPRDFGGFSVKAVADIAAEMLPSNNFVGGSGSNLAEQTKKMVDKVREVSKALVPLRDMFGEDIPRMMQMLESMAGRNISGNPDQIKALTYRLSSTLQATGATAAQYAAVMPVFNQGTVDPFNQSRAVLGAGRLGMDYLAATANISVPGITSNELQTTAASHLTGTARSAAVTTYQKAVASLVLQGKAKTVAEADAMMKKNLGGTRDMDANSAYLAAFQASGGSATSIASLNAAAGSTAMADAAGANMGLDVTVDKQLQTMKDRAVGYLRGSGDPKDAAAAAALEKLTPEEYARAISENTDKSSIFTKNGQSDTDLAYRVLRASVSSGESIGVLKLGSQVKDVQALGNTIVTGRKNLERAEKASIVSKHIDKISATSGIVGVIDAVYKAGEGNTTIVDALGGFLGKIDYGAAVKAWKGASEADQKEAGENFMYMLQNAIALTPYQLEQGAIMMDGNRSDAERRKASRNIAATRDLSGYLSKISADKDKQRAIDEYVQAKEKAGDKFNATNWMSDREVAEALASGKFTGAQKPFVDAITAATQADDTGTRDGLRKEYLKKFSAEQQKEASAAFDEILKDTTMAASQLSWLKELLENISGFLERISLK